MKFYFYFLILLFKFVISDRDVTTITKNVGGKYSNYSLQIGKNIPTWVLWFICHIKHGLVGQCNIGGCIHLKGDNPWLLYLYSFTLLFSFQIIIYSFLCIDLGGIKTFCKNQSQSGRINLWSLLALWNNIFLFSLFQELHLIA